MKNLLCTACLCSLLFTGCIKDQPGMPPPPEKPKWVLTKVIERTETYNVAYDTFEYRKDVHEFKYNEHYKPAVHLLWISGPDTSVQRLLQTDTFYYDQQSRITHINYAYQGHSAVERMRFTYNGNSRWPATRSALGANTHEYQYFGDTVVMSIADLGSIIDTTIYRYDPQENYVGETPAEAPYWDYDMAPNAASLLNVDHGLIFGTSGINISGFDMLPWLSANNWRERFPSSGPQSPRFLEYTADGLLSYASWVENYIYYFKISYEYQKVE